MQLTPILTITRTIQQGYIVLIRLVTLMYNMLEITPYYIFKMKII